MVRNSVFPGLHGNPMGRGWQWLPGWKSKVQWCRCQGSWHLVSYVLTNTILPPLSDPAKDSGLCCSRNPSIAPPHSFPSRCGNCPHGLTALPDLLQGLLPICHLLGRVLHILPQWVLRNSMVGFFAWIGGRKRDGENEGLIMIYPVILLLTN